MYLWKTRQVDRAEGWEVTVMTSGSRLDSSLAQRLESRSRGLCRGPRCSWGKILRCLLRNSDPGQGCQTEWRGKIQEIEERVLLSCHLSGLSLLLYPWTWAWEVSAPGMGEPPEHPLHVRGAAVDIHPGCPAQQMLAMPPDLQVSEDRSAAPVPSLVPGCCGPTGH